jgi:hypothetical protein
VLACSLAFVALTALAAAGRGYRDFWVSYDILPDYENAANFVDKGWLPIKGSLKRLSTFNPPGYRWLYVPGVWLFPAHPGLAAALGSAMLFSGTIVGLALLLRTTFGLGTSIGTAAMFSYSSIGIFYASSLWPRAHVFFYCWTVYFLKRWALDEDRGGFAAALAMYALGLYCFFEIAPLGLLFVAAWIVYRPATARLPLMACLVLLLIVWWPYLGYEAGRAGFDVRSFVTGQRTQDGHFIFKVADDYDMVFRRRHGIENQSVAEIGFSPADKFRIVELVSTDGFQDLRLQSGDLSHFTEMVRFGNYWVGRKS